MRLSVLPDPECAYNDRIRCVADVLRIVGIPVSLQNL